MGAALRVLAPIVLWATSAAAQPAWVAPPEPGVRPNLPARVELDIDNNRVDDRIDHEIGSLRRALARETVLARREELAARLAAPVRVEVVFSEQVTQQQIEDFAAVGGRIEHLYRSVSYGWSGTIPGASVDALATAMGPSLLVVAQESAAQLHMDEATRTGRIRPIWAPGFAGNANGFSGTSDITIGVIDSGIDDSHSDLAGRVEYWKDYTADNEANPRDVLQHGSHVAGIALGSGAVFGAGPGTLKYTDSGNLTGVPANSFFLSGIHVPAVPMTYTLSSAWLGGGSTLLRMAARTNGVSGGFISICSNAIAGSPLSLACNSNGNATQIYSSALPQSSTTSITRYATTVSVAPYPAVGDGFNSFRGVAPGTRWAGAKVFTNAGSGSSTTIGAAIDDLVTQRSAHKIKVVNMSLGIIGSPGLDPTLRAKANTMVNNGIVVVCSAGNDGPGSAAANVVDDPGRASLVMTVGAANDNNALTRYSSSGFASPGADEDMKPDLLAPGGSDYYSQILSVDSNDADAEVSTFADRVANDYLNIKGTSMSSPFAAGSAALVVDAMQKGGASWAFASSAQPLFVKMLLCASSTETNAVREAASNSNPALGRAATPKDIFEGYGMMNPDAAVEAVSQTYSGGMLSGSTSGGNFDRRAWGRKLGITSGPSVTLTLDVPPLVDYDLYLYSGSPDAKGNPVIRASSTNAGPGVNESITFTPTSTETRYLFVKRVAVTTCRVSTAECDVNDAATCNGTNPTCTSANAAATCACEPDEACVANPATTSNSGTCSSDPWILDSSTSSASCGDGNKTGGEECDDGNLVGGDCCSSACTLEANGSPCNDGLYCTATDTCSSGVCSGTGSPCSAGGECNNSCNESADNCATAAGTTCSTDSNPCTLDQCNGSGSCAHPAGNAGAVCRTANGACDVQETCSGTATACPADAFAGTTTTCRAAGSVCDVAEKCSGSAAACPSDAFASSTTACRASGGVCDVAENCTGSSGTCPANTLAATTTMCRASGGICDAQENCNGTAATCPADVYSSSTTICRSSSGICDAAETCTGSGGSCPADVLADASTVCRAATGLCDVQETCTGSTATCPANGFAASTTVCRASLGVCDAAETCTGSASSCPADVFASPATTCRAAAGVCDVSESCSGTSGSCPGDTLAGSATVCRGSAGVCDVEERCNGVIATCPVDSLAGTSTVCRGASGVCDVQETCSGSAVSCGIDAVASGATVCRASTGECDVTESCDGAGKTCPANGFAAADTTCSSDGVVCTEDICSGASATCTHPAGNPGTICRASAGVCDLQETCTGASTSCPADAFAASTTSCRAASGICDAQETCNGNSAACPLDGFAATTTVCRSAGGVCDAAETCTGSASSCPADAVASSATTCRASTGECDLAEKCNGSAKTCAVDAFVANSTGCTNDGNACTNDLCNGSSGACQHPNNSASCNDGVFCNGADTCSGGACGVHAGNPCSGPDGDANCAETCNEVADACTAPDPDNSACNDGLSCTTSDACQAGACVAGQNDCGVCGDGSVDDGEQCDDGNTANGDCCSSTCTPVGNGIACNDGQFCNGTDSCQAGACSQHTGNPCPGADGDGDCSETCNETADACSANDTDASACDDGQFCNGADTCVSGACSQHAGSPCAGADGDGDCSETCKESNDTCTASDPDQSACDDGVFCNGADTCNNGSCSTHGTAPCIGADGDGNCAESCNEAGDDCTAADANGSACNDNAFCNGADSCSNGVCNQHAGSPCPGADGDGNCVETCSEGADACSAADPDDSPCTDGLPCTVNDSCQGGVCSGDSSVAVECSGTTTTTLPEFTCGDTNDDGKITAGDALFSLRTAVGTTECVNEICDYSGDGRITATDALFILRTAVGQDVAPKCPGTLAALEFVTSTLPITTTTLDEGL